MFYFSVASKQTASFGTPTSDETPNAFAATRTVVSERRIAGALTQTVVVRLIFAVGMPNASGRLATTIGVVVTALWTGNVALSWTYFVGTRMTSTSTLTWPYLTPLTDSWTYLSWS